MLKQDAASSDLNIDAGTLFLDVSNNRVGIANTSPSQALDVTGNAVFSGNAVVSGSVTSTGLTVNAAQSNFNDSAGSVIAFQKSASAKAWIANRSYGFHNGNGLAINTTDANPIRFGTNNTERLRIDSSGRVGIGTSSVLRKLQVVDSAFFGTTNSGVVVGDNGGVASVYGMNAAGDTYRPLEIRTGSSGTGFYQDTSGRVGIGTTSPAATLDVVKTGAGIQDTLQLRNAQTLAAGVGSSLGFGDSGGARLAYIAGAATGANNDNGYLSFYTRASDSLAERMRIDSSGKVGIGTQVPAGALHVYNSTGGEQFISSGNSAMRFVSTGGINYIQSGTATSSSSAAPLVFSNVGGTGETMRIDSSGNVGIGTTAPSQRLHIVGNALYMTDGTYGGFLGKGNTVFSGGAADDLALRSQAGLKLGAGGNNIHMSITSSGNVGIGTNSPSSVLEVAGSAAVLTITDTRNQTFTVGDTMCSLAFDSDDASGGAGTASHPRALISLVAETTFGSSTGLSFSTKQDTTTAPTEKMRINTAGNVGIGTTAPGRKLHLKDGQIKFQNTGSGGWAGLDFSMGNGTYDGYMGMLDSNGSFFIDVDSNGNDLVILQNGNVGIGTNSPSAPLHITHGTPSIKFTDSSSSANYSMTLDGVTVNNTNSGTNGSIAFHTHNGEKLRLGATNSYFSNTNVGIGTSSPESLLTIQNDDAGIRLRSNTTTAKGLTLRYNHSGNFGQLLVDHQGNNQLAMKYYALTHTFGRSDSDVNVVMDSSGRLLVGSTTTDASTSERFLVKSTSSEHSRFVNSSDTYSTVYIKNTSTTANTNQPFLTFQDTGGNRGNFGLRYSTAQLVIQGHGGVGIAGGSGFTQDPDLFVNSSGNVGIGTDTPGAKLHVKHGDIRLEGNGESGQDITFTITNDNSGNEVEAGLIRFIDTGGGQSNRGAAIASYMPTADTGDLRFYTSAGADRVERMRIYRNGNVGIGTTNPPYQLSMKHASGPTLMMTRTSTNTSGSIGRIVFGNNDWDSSMASICAVQDGTNDGAKIEFKTQFNATGGEQNRMVIKKDGNVGIGTSAPQGILHVAQSRTSGGDLWTTIGAGNAAALHIQNTGNAANTNAVLYFRNSSAEKASIGARFVNQSTGETELRFGTTNSSGASYERMRLDGDGKLGIGFTDPSGSLHVTAKDNGGSDVFIVAQNTTNNRISGYKILDEGGNIQGLWRYDNGGNYASLSVGTAAAPTTITLGESSTGISFTSTATSFNSGKVATIRGEVTGTGHGNLAFDTFQGGSGGGERMVILADGRVGIGQTSFGVNGKLQVTGGIGLTGTSVIRNSTNADDGSTLKFLGNQFVAGQNNSHSYSYSGGGLIASVSPSAGAIMLDAGANSTSGHRLKVVNGSNGSDGSLQYLSGTTRRFYVDSSTGKVGIGVNSPDRQLHVGGSIKVGDDNAFEDTGDNFYGGVVFQTPIYTEYQYVWNGTDDHETNLYTGSYFMAEIVFTQHQTNGGTDINRHFVGKWANNHTHHELETIHDSGSTWSMTTSMTATDHNLVATGVSGSAANGRLRIVETYGSGSYSKSTLTVRVYTGSISNITHTYG